MKSSGGPTPTPPTPTPRTTRRTRTPSQTPSRRFTRTPTSNGRSGRQDRRQTKTCGRAQETANRGIVCQDRLREPRAETACRRAPRGCLGHSPNSHHLTGTTCHKFTYHITKPALIRLNRYQNIMGALVRLEAEQDKQTRESQTAEGLSVRYAYGIQRLQK